MLPVALRSLRKLEDIVDEEMSRIGGQKLDMPLLLSAELWKKTGRWEAIGHEMFRLKDRNGDDYLLAPTHEEAFTSLVAHENISHRSLPLRLYQMGKKYRDEKGRAGLIRSREFIMKDMYSFDRTKALARVTYDAVCGAYARILGRLGLPHVRAEATTGNIGGTLSHEFHIVADAGSDELLVCACCGYAANVEKARSRLAKRVALKLPASASMADLLQHPGVKRQLFRIEHKDGVTHLAAVLHAGDNLNEVAVEDHARLGGGQVTKLGSADLPEGTSILLDHTLSEDAAVPPVGATLMHLRKARDGEKCPVESCDGLLSSRRGMEVGHAFYLGTKYSNALRAVFSDESGDMAEYEMGCFGLGVSRLLAASVEVRADSKGLRWPTAIAPYSVAVVTVDSKIATPEGTAKAHEVYDAIAKVLPTKGDVVLDSRPVRLGNKLVEAELFGYPFVVVLGRAMAQRGLLEVQVREDGSKHELSLADTLTLIARHTNTTL